MGGAVVPGEKASAYLKAKGVANVGQLEGGIHRYLEQCHPRVIISIIKTSGLTGIYYYVLRYRC
jgi:hypothetical protein